MELPLLASHQHSDRTAIGSHVALSFSAFAGDCTVRCKFGSLLIKSRLKLRVSVFRSMINCHHSSTLNTHTRHTLSPGNLSRIGCPSSCPLVADICCCCVFSSFAICLGSPTHSSCRMCWSSQQGPNRINTSSLQWLEHLSVCDANPLIAL